MTSPTSKRQRTIAALSLLQARFPALFPAKAADVRPLALDIHQDIAARMGIEPGADLKAMGWALRKWCQREGYKRALARGGDRHDLDGHAVAAVTEEHRRKALALVEDLDADRRAKAQLKTGKRPPAVETNGKAEPPARTRRPPGPDARPPQRPMPRPPQGPASPTNPAVRVVEVIVKKRRTIVLPA